MFDTFFLTLFNPWVLFGFFAQFIFFLRFAVQWFISERKKKSTVPISFWWISILGTILITIYSVHIKDVVFTIASLLSFVIYIRNLMLIHKEK